MGSRASHATWATCSLSICSVTMTCATGKSKQHELNIVHRYLQHAPANLNTFLPRMCLQPMMSAILSWTQNLHPLKLCHAPRARAKLNTLSQKRSWKLWQTMLNFAGTNCGASIQQLECWWPFAQANLNIFRQTSQLQYTCAGHTTRAEHDWSTCSTSSPTESCATQFLTYSVKLFNFEAHGIKCQPLHTS